MRQTALNVNFKCLRSNAPNIRSSRPGLFCKKGVLRNLAKFTEKHLCQGLFFNKEEKKLK